MKTVLRLVACRPSLPTLLAMLMVLACGCTSALWDNETFAHHYRPAGSANLRLFYWKERQDILVQYDESKDGAPNVRSRCYWLEPNTLRVNKGQKPHFVSARVTGELVPIPVGETAPQLARPVFKQLYAVTRHGDDFFTLYCGQEKLDPYKLPVYTGASQRAKQVLLTPFAIAIDATVIGAVIAYYSAPQLLLALNR